jgi:SWI/SNF-related matrix-associated actin-dependent regulator 1 of chromatin subfamily A
MIIDESHFCKSSKSKRTKSVKTLAKKIKVIYELTGTVISNRPNELVSQLNILGLIDEFGGDWGFLMRYCDGKKGGFGWDFSGASNLLELHEKLRANCYIRRESKDVLKELPDITRSIVDIEITNKKEYKKAEKDLIEYLRGFKYREEEIVEWVHKNHKKEWDELSNKEQKLIYKEFKEEKIDKASSAEHLVRINILRQLVSKGKRKGIIEWVEDFLENDKKLVLFGYHTQEIKDIANHFKIIPIIGETSTENRQKIVDDFQENPETKLIILNTKIGGVGLTLTAASYLAFLETGWVPSEFDQGEKRIHRIGQKNHSNIYYFLGKSTIDEDMHELVNEKRIITNAINKGLKTKKDIKILGELIKRIESRE